MSIDNNREFSSYRVPTFDRTSLESIHRPIDLNKWDKVLDLFVNGMSKEALIGIIDFVDSQLVQKTGNQDKSEFNIPHGSIIVNLKIDRENFNVNVPFLKVPAANYIPLLRQVTQLNIRPLNLAEIVLENHQLVFKYTCPLDMCEPNKIYDVLREICTYADLYDDEFIKKFGAEWIHKPVIKRFSRDFCNFAWQRIQLYLKEASAYIELFRRKRLDDYSLQLLTATLLKIHYYIEPRGILGTNIEKTIGLLQHRETPVTDKLRKGMEFLNYLQNYNPDEFAKDLYAVDIFIPVKYSIDVQQIENYWQEISGPVKESIVARDYIAAVLTIQDAFFDLLYNYIVPYSSRRIIIESLLNSNGKTWVQASSILEDALDAIINTTSDIHGKIKKHKTKKRMKAKKNE
jgi:hypothetical protein